MWLIDLGAAAAASLRGDDGAGGESAGGQSALSGRRSLGHDVARNGDWGRGAGTAYGDEELIGTVPYMSPEALTEHAVGRWSDVWAVGVVAYECLTGICPFSGPSAVRRMDYSRVTCCSLFPNGLLFRRG